MYDYDVVAIGAGSGGCASCMRSVDNGKKKVALVEYRKGGTGGTCVSRGCIPTKALLRSAEVYAEVKNAKKLGIIVDGAQIVAHRQFSMQGETALTISFSSPEA